VRPKKVNKRIHKTLEINYNFPSKVYEKSKAEYVILEARDIAAKRIFRISSLRFAGSLSLVVHPFVLSAAATYFSISRHA